MKMKFLMNQLIEYIDFMCFLFIPRVSDEDGSLDMEEIASDDDISKDLLTSDDGKLHSWGFYI